MSKSEQELWSVAISYFRFVIADTFSKLILLKYPGRSALRPSWILDTLNCVQNIDIVEHFNNPWYVPAKDLQG